MGFVFKTEICPCVLLLPGWSSDRASQISLSKSKIIILTGISANQKQLIDFTLRFSSEVLNLSRKVPIKQITLSDKLTKKC